MKRPTRKFRSFLLPFSWLYGVAVWFRNSLFNLDILKSQKFEVPVICVGNITVGGTGKTPHVEYLTELLSGDYKVGVLSRGYKRKSSGYREVFENSLARDVGDEPLQIKRKFPEALVVVDKDRRNGITKMLALPEEKRPDVILLDDGFQHRYVKPSLSILLVDINRPVYEDRLLPAGNLREPLKGKDRASIVLMTKSPADMLPIDFRIYEEKMDLFAFQKIYFTTFVYGNPVPLFSDADTPEISLNDLTDKQIYLVGGIAQPEPLLKELKRYSDDIITNFYPDHYLFKEADIEEIVSEVRNIDTKNKEKLIITTEKDAARLRAFTGMEEDIKTIFYYIPIKVEFMRNKSKELFNKKIIRHVRKYQTNSRIPKR